MVYQRPYLSESCRSRVLQRHSCVTSFGLQPARSNHHFRIYSPQPVRLVQQASWLIWTGKSNRPMDPGPRQQVNVFWDIENIQPSQECLARSELGLKDLSCRLFPELKGQVALHVSAQPASLRRRSGYLSDAVTRHLAPSNKRNAADLVLKQAIYDFAKQYGHDACAMLVSGDTGFVDILDYCKACGCLTVAIGRGQSKDLKHELQWHRSTLAQHADMAVTWTHAEPHALAQLTSLRLH